MEAVAHVSSTTILWLFFAAAFAFGVIGQRTHFCTMGAVSDIVNMEDWSRMRQWLLAIAVAILGSAALHGAGLIDLDKSLYRGAHFTWLSHLVGGFAFGIGMVLASGCGSKTLIRIGGGNLKSLVVMLVLAISAYTTMRGILSVFRVNVLEQAAFTLEGGQDLPNLLETGLGIAPGMALAISALVLGGGLLLFVLKERGFWTFDNLLGGVGTGLIVVVCWYISGHLGYLPEDPETLEEAFLATQSGRMESLTFVAPQAYTLDLLMFWSDASRKLTVAIVTVLGVICGSAAHALLTRRFRWEGFRDVEDTAHHLIGAALMGFGGITAMGCSIGQGITGFSTLALGSIITFAAILLGAWAALKYQYGKAMNSEA
ncbi:MAG: YeeE/YedE family protein [Azovibrio sp.]|uniref:YeeE/YedE family protein n=1 Tax=Azovibrio sp. TaxID=1872673 RepID=UPI003C71E1A2